MLSYKYLLQITALTVTISIQLATAKKDEDLQSIATQSNNLQSNDNTRQSMTWSPTIAPPPNTPFPTYNSNNNDGLIPITSLSLPPIIPILSPDLCASNLPCTQELQQCTDGTTESCCNKTYESFICNCEANLESGELQWMCYYTDACFIPSCDEDGDDGEEPVVEIAIDDGEVSDALQSTLPVDTDAPVSTPVTVEPTTANPTTAKVSLLWLSSMSLTILSFLSWVSLQMSLSNTLFCLFYIPLF